MLDQENPESEEINLADCKIEVLTPELVNRLAQFQNLERLDLSNNPIGEFPNNFGALANIE
jgi:Leucine-rich repeat (LRR) protein